MIIVDFSEIMALECSGVCGRTEAELGLFFFLARTALIMVVLFASWGGGGVNAELAVDFLSVWNEEKYGKLSGYARANASAGTSIF